MRIERKLEPPVPSTSVSMSLRCERVDQRLLGARRVAGRVLVAVGLGDLERLSVFCSNVTESIESGSSLDLAAELVEGRRVLAARAG